jgi:hypothetical protein
MTTSAKLYITLAVALAAIFTASCTREPNKKDGVVRLETAVGTIAVPPGSYETLKEKIRGDINSRSYSKANDMQNVTLTGSESNLAVFETGTTPGTANLRIKGSKEFVDKIITQAERITGSSATLTRLTLVSETITYAGFQESHVAVLEKELAKTMSATGRSKSSFNHAVTIKCSFEKELHDVRFKYSGKNASLNVTIEGDQEFVDGIKSLLSNTKDSED